MPITHSIHTDLSCCGVHVRLKKKVEIILVIRNKNGFYFPLFLNAQTKTNNDIFVQTEINPKCHTRERRLACASALREAQNIYHTGHPHRHPHTPPSSRSRSRRPPVASCHSETQLIGATQSYLFFDTMVLRFSNDTLTTLNLL